MAFALGVALFAFGWLTVSLVISLIGGWFWLARAYPCRRDKRFESKVIFGSLAMNWLASYRASVTVGTNAEGMYLRPILPFRFMHPPVFIPWTEIAEPKAGRFLWMSTFEFAPRNGARVVQLFGAAATLAKTTTPLATGRGAWRTVAFQSAAVLALALVAGSFIARNAHLTDAPAFQDLRVDSTSARSDGAPKSPIADIAWIVGNWTCKATNWETGQPQALGGPIQYRAVLEADGRAISSATKSAAFFGEGRTFWSPSRAAYIDQTAVRTVHGPMQIESVMREEDVLPDSFTFTGVVKAAGYEAAQRATTTRTGTDSFSGETSYWIHGAWKKMAADSCFRIPAGQQPVTSHSSIAV